VFDDPETLKVVRQGLKAGGRARLAGRSQPLVSPHLDPLRADTGVNADLKVGGGAGRRVMVVEAQLDRFGPICCGTAGWAVVVGSVSGRPDRWSFFCARLSPSVVLA
jgi:hypothetical protein